MNTDDYFMKKALRLARKVRGQTSPNPLVGSVIVKNGKIAGEGFHSRAGLAHAEIEALKEAKGKAKKGCLYVTLEPCDHFGKTPPCTDAIIASGLKRVVVGMRDPNPLNNGRGIYKLKKSGIEVKEGVLKKEAEDLNRPFIKFITKRIPYVTVKVAQSLDGKIATKSGDSKWISGRDSIRFVHRLRKQADAVLVGINTVLKDDPLLTSRFPGISRIQPRRIVIDSRLRIPLGSRLLNGPCLVVIATTGKAPRKKVKELKKRGIDIIITGGNNGGVDLKSLLRYLAGQGIVHILVEGGGKTISSFLREGLVDEILFFISPRIIGGRDAITSVEGEGIKFMKQAMPLEDVRIKRVGKDFLIQARPIYRLKTKDRRPKTF